MTFKEVNAKCVPLKEANTKCVPLKEVNTIWMALKKSLYKMSYFERSVSVGIKRSISQYDVPVHRMLSSYLGGHISILAWANHEKHLKYTLKMMAWYGRVMNGVGSG